MMVYTKSNKNQILILYYSETLGDRNLRTPFMPCQEKRMQQDVKECQLQMMLSHRRGKRKQHLSQMRNGNLNPGSVY